MQDSVDRGSVIGTPNTAGIGERDSSGIKRIRQACSNCRKKKVRCSGTRPTCNFCLRLSQPCHYTDVDVAQNARSGSDIESSAESSLLLRIEFLEAQLKQSQDRASSNFEFPRSPPTADGIGTEFMQDSAFQEQLREIKVEEIRAASARAHRLQEEEDDRIRRRREEEEDRRRRIAQENEDRARREAAEIEEHNRKLRVSELAIAEAQARKSFPKRHFENSDPRSLDMLQTGRDAQIPQWNASGISFDKDSSPGSLDGVFRNDRLRTMQPTLEMPPIELVKESINCYFQFGHNQPYSLFHEASFRSRFERGLIPDYLILLLFSFSLRFSTDLQANDYFKGRASDFAALYKKESWRIIVERWNNLEEETDVASAQAICLHSCLDFTDGRIHKSWIQIGIVVRICQDLRLMHEPDAKLPITEQEERRRVFWSVYMQDKFASCGEGRVSVIQDEDCKVQLPCDESSFRLGLPVKTVRLDQLGNRDTTVHGSLSPFAMAIFMASTLGRCAKFCLHDYNGPSHMALWDPTCAYTSITSTLLYFESSFHMKDSFPRVLAENYTTDGVLDQQAAPHLLLTHALFNLCQCLINHPLFLASNRAAPKSFVRRALDVAREHATSMSSLLQDAESANVSVSSSIYGYCSVVAGSIHALDAHAETENTRTEAINYLDFSLASLKNLSRYWKNADIMFRILQNFREHSSRYSKALLIPSATPGPEQLNSYELETLGHCMDYYFLSRQSSLLKLQDTIAVTPKTSGVTRSCPGEPATDTWGFDNSFSMDVDAAAQPFNMDFSGTKPLQDFDFDMGGSSETLFNQGGVGEKNNGGSSGKENEFGILASQSSDHESPLFRFLMSQSTE